MSALPELLRRVGRRLQWIALAEGAAAGLALAAIVGLAAWVERGHVLAIATTALVLGSSGALARLLATSRNPRWIASIIERRTPVARNIILTAAELAGQRTTIRADVQARVFRDADRLAGALDPSQLLPARRALVSLGAAVLLLAIALVLGSARPAESGSVALPSPVTADGVSIDHIDVVITPPAYTGRAAQALSNPPRIEALAGSRMRVTVRATAAAVRLETISGAQSLARAAARTFTQEISADADGFIAVEALAADGHAGARRLIGLAVTPDRPPRVRITTPGRDLFLPEARGTVAIAVEADDDLALASLKLRYTRVSGSDERFTFSEGETSLTISRTDARRWTARGALPIGAMELGQGDLVVYRAVATDRRPGAAPVESDAFLVEVTAPGAVVSEGFAADDELDRNAVSQQMVILKTERLLARRSSLTPEALAEEARGLAAEQRRVRAEFVFMMGGELAEDVTGATGISELHEEEEAEASDDILAGRLANRGRVELVQAIRAMSEADAKLTAVDVVGALKDEQVALAHLQNAFSRTRYILRALSRRERLDLTRRLTGALSDAGRDVRPIAEAATDPRIATLREALSGIAALAGSLASGKADANASTRASILAQGVLRVDPSSDTLQAIAARLGEAGSALDARRIGDARTLVDRAGLGLAAIIRNMLPAAAAEPGPIELRRLHGALGDALRGAARR